MQENLILYINIGDISYLCYVFAINVCQDSSWLKNLGRSDFSLQEK